MVSKKDREHLLKEKYRNKKSIFFYFDMFRLYRNEPLAYVIGTIPFLDCTIDLSYKPLIPRTETEFWVERAITEIQKQPRENTSIAMLDLYAGSGCIGVALLKHIPDATMVFGEKDPKLIGKIQKNI